MPPSIFKRLRRRITRSPWFLDAVGAAARCVIAALARTVRMERRVDPAFGREDPKRVLYAFWHGRQFLLIWGSRGTGMATLIEESSAGEVQRRVMSRFGYRLVQASTKGRGAEALVRLVRTLRESGPGALAVDGPSGPNHRSKPGIIKLSRTLGWPIIPAAASCSPAMIIRRTWCLYLLPAPFARGAIVIGAPIRPGDDFDTAELDRALARVTTEADRMTGLSGG